MASCDSCKQEMSDGISCKVEDVDIMFVDTNNAPPVKDNKGSE